MDIFKDAFFLGNRINLKTDAGIRQLFDLIDHFQETGQLNSQTMTAIKLAGLLDNALKALDVCPEFHTYEFRVTGTGRIPMDMLVRYGMFPADQWTASLMEESYADPRVTNQYRTYRFAMNTQMSMSVAFSIIRRFQSFGFSAQLMTADSEPVEEEESRLAQGDKDDS